MPRGRIINISSIVGFLPAPFMSIYAASKHAVEGFSESLDHEVRTFGIRIVVIEPSFTRTQLGHNSPSTRESLPDYRGDRERVLARVATSLEHGADPASVAHVVHRAVTASVPPRRYQVGREARLLRILRSMAPSSILDGGIRKSFGLGAAS